MVRDSRHCRESRRAVQVRRNGGAKSGRRAPVLVERPVQFSQKCSSPYLSVCRRCPKYWCHRTRATRRLPCANCDFT
ncbi:hypothetical protein DF038_36220 [Burkholderia cepacia]|nr:hypothetical protein DF045_34570 [Burkholderia cepacia]RRA16416.1 hypothetical protein DF038_36220 [Burkholderia cepacia]